MYAQYVVESSTWNTLSPLQLSMPFPSEGLVYDYRLDDGGLSQTGKKGDDDEEEEKRTTKTKVQTYVVQHLYYVHRT